MLPSRDREGAVLAIFPKLSVAILLLFALTVRQAAGHAEIQPVIRGPLTVTGNRLIDPVTGPVLLRGINFPGLHSADQRALDAMTSVTFGILRLRWNINIIRLPVSIARWSSEGPAYVARVKEVVRIANDNDLAVLIAAMENERPGGAASLGLPAAATVAFWRAWAAGFKDNPRVIFGAFHEPSARNVPGAALGTRTAADWRFWRNGGTAAAGTHAFGMQDIVDAIRGEGARQVIAVSAFHDPLGFRGMTPAEEIQDPNILYEVHPFFSFWTRDEERDEAFGRLAERLPVLAGEWGVTFSAGCPGVPRDGIDLNQLLFETLYYFDRRRISWAAASMEPGSLVRDFVEFEPTSFDRTIHCGAGAPPEVGIGQAIIVWITGDPRGFGALRTDLIVNAASGLPGPVAPGELVTIYAEQLGPAEGAAAKMDADGNPPLELAGTRVLFNGSPVPVLSTGPFEILVQASRSLEPGGRAVVQAFYRHVPSNRVELDVVEAAPELFHELPFRYAMAANQDGSRNSSANPAAGGTIVVLYGTGGGRATDQTEVDVDGRPAEVLFAGEAAGFVGLMQINARLPGGAGGTRRAAPVTVRMGGRASRNPVSIWIE
jgi:uncharacterized protein (TIGR03437 family)